MRPERPSRRTVFQAAAVLLAACCAAGAAAELRFDHEPVAAATSGERIAITAAIAAETPDDVELARVYFKAWNEANFLFVPMTRDGDGWTGTLPAPAAGVEAIEYLILAKRRPEGVYKTETFRIEVSDGDRVADYADRIDVYSELESAPETVAGFTDNIALDVVESAARYGLVAGLSGQAGSGATAAASGAGASGGTAGAGAGGAFGGVGAVGIGAGVAAAVGVGVAVTDDDDDDEPNRPPEFGGSGALSIEVPENTTGAIGSAGASDPDGDALTYSLSGADAEFFVVDAGGELSVAGSTDLDYEERTEYSFTVTVSDGELSATRDVTVTVTDENEAPAFEDADALGIEVAENTTGVIGSAGGASDPDGDALTYSLSGADAGFFVISASGELSVASSTDLDYEERTEYSFTVTVSDGDLSATRDVTVTVTDENEAPAFEDADALSIEVAEGTTGVIGSAGGASDPDGDALTYSLSGADAEFFVVDAGGELSVAGSTVLDYEERSEYSFTVTVSDGTLSATRDVTVSVTDENEAPAFEDSDALSIEVAEGTTGVIGSVAASDPDGDELTYSLSGADAEFFVVDASGELSVASTTKLDFEARNEYAFTLTVSDGNLSATRNVSVIVVDVVERPGRVPQPEVRIADPDFTLQVLWEPPPNGGPVSHYELRYRTANSEEDEWLTLERGALEAQLRNLEEYTTYEIQVRAINDGGAGDWSTSTEGTTRRASRGGMHIDLYWDNADDHLDLHITDPCGNRVHAVGSRSGFPWDVVCQGYSGWIGGTYSERLRGSERAVFYHPGIHWFWGAPEGEYSIEVDFVSGSEAIEYELTINWSPVGGASGMATGCDFEYGETICQIRGTLSPSGDRRDIHNFTYTWPGSTSTSDRSAPNIDKLTLVSHPGPDGHYGAGEDIEVTLDFSDAVEVQGTPQLSLDIGATTVAANYVGASDGRSLTFRYRVVPGNRDLDGISVGIDALRLNGGAIVSANDTPADTNLGAHVIVNASDHIVDTEALDAERAVVEDALAAEGRAHLSSVTDVIGGRFRAGPGASPPSGGAIPGRLSSGRTSWSGAGVGQGFFGHDGQGFHGNGSWDAFASLRNEPGCGAGAAGAAMDGHCRAWRNGNAGWTERALFAAGSGHGMPADFALPLSGEENESNSWTLWGAGDWQSFSGKTAQGAYDGNLRSHYLGIDGAVGERWMAGVAFSRSAGDTGYEYAAGEHAGAGALRTRLTSAYPYFRVRPREGVEAWGIGGFGSGKATLERTDRAAATSGLRLGLGAFGMKLGLADLGGMNLSWVADGGVAALRTGSSEDAVLSGLGVLVNRVRVGVEGEHAITFSESRTLHPFWRASARHDGGDGVTGRGMEVSAGMRYRSARLEAEVRGRWLATHSADDYEETGASASLRIVPGRDGLGLAASLSHRWGAPGGGADLVWERDFARTPSGGWRGRDPWSLNGDIGFGFGWPHTTVVVTPFTEVGLAGDAAVRQRLGVRLDQGGGGWQRFTSEFALLRHDAGYGDTAGAIELRAELRL